jgi:UDP-N-acetylglucosamine 4,6-dehydratase
LIGSTGSVVELWRSQVARGETITVTDPAATRFWVRVERAAYFIAALIEGIEGGEIAVPRLGGASVGRLAHAVAPGQEQRCVGLRPGEKMHEALLAPHEYERARWSRFSLAIERTAVPEGDKGLRGDFVYHSDLAPMSDEELRELIA